MIDNCILPTLIMLYTFHEHLACYLNHMLELLITPIQGYLLCLQTI